MEFIIRELCHNAWKLLTTNTSKYNNRLLIPLTREQKGETLFEWTSAVWRWVVMWYAESRAVFYAQMRRNYAHCNVPCISSVWGPHLSLVRHTQAKSNQFSLWEEKGGRSFTAGPAATMTDSQHLTNHWSELDTRGLAAFFSISGWDYFFKENILLK